MAKAKDIDRMTRKLQKAQLMLLRAEVALKQAKEVGDDWEHGRWIQTAFLSTQDATTKVQSLLASLEATNESGTGRQS